MNIREALTSLNSGEVSITYITRSGERRHIAKAILNSLLNNETGKGRRSGSKEPARSFNPASIHTLNIKNLDGSDNIRKVHLDLITHINGKEVW